MMEITEEERPLRGEDLLNPVPVKSKFGRLPLETKKNY